MTKLNYVETQKKAEPFDSACGYHRFRKHVLKLLTLRLDMCLQIYQHIYCAFYT